MAKTECFVLVLVFVLVLESKAPYLCKPETKSRVCINVSNSANPSRVYVRLCKHGKRFLNYCTSIFDDVHLETKCRKKCNAFRENDSLATFFFYRKTAIAFRSAFCLAFVVKGCKQNPYWLFQPAGANAPSKQLITMAEGLCLSA